MTERNDLRSFRCTDSSPWVDEDTGEECHEYPWELEVERHINDWRPPAHPPNFLLLGYDGSGLASVIEMIVNPVGGHCFIPAIAVAHRVSRRGLAGEALATTAEVMALYGIQTDYVVEGRIDPNNWAAKSAFTGQGFRAVESLNGYEVWARKY